MIIERLRLFKRHVIFGLLILVITFYANVSFILRIREPLDLVPEPSREVLQMVYTQRLAVDPLPAILTAPTIDLTTNEYVVYVKNRPKSYDARMKYRERREELFGKNPVVFVIGITDDPEVEARLALESIKFGDFLIGDYPDDYQTLRQKDLIRLKHFVEFSNAPASVMIDDDTVPHMTPDLVHSLLRDNNDKVHCMFLTFGHSRPKRSPESRWFTAVEEYPLEFFPPYCAGPCFGLGRTAAEDIFNAAKTHEFSLAGSIDDVYTTGILRTLSDTGLLDDHTGVCRGHNDLLRGHLSAQVLE